MKLAVGGAALARPLDSPVADSRTAATDGDIDLCGHRSGTSDRKTRYASAAAVPKARYRIIGDAVSQSDSTLAKSAKSLFEKGLEIRAPADTKTRAEIPPLCLLIPRLCMNKRGGTVLNWSTGDESAVFARVGGRILLPTHAVVYGQVTSELPLILSIDVVLVHLVDDIKEPQFNVADT